MKMRYRQPFHEKLENTVVRGSSDDAGGGGGKGWVARAGVGARVRAGAGVRAGARACARACAWGWHVCLLRPGGSHDPITCPQHALRGSQVGSERFLMPANSDLAIGFGTRLREALTISSKYATDRGQSCRFSRHLAACLPSRCRHSASSSP